MASVAPLAELLDMFMNSEYRDLYSVGGLALFMALTWARRNVGWKPTHLFKNTRTAWTKLSKDGDDKVIQVLCTTAPLIADILLFVYHAARGFERKAPDSQVIRTLHDSLLQHDSSYRDEFRSFRETLDQAKQELSTSIAEIREKVYVNDALERGEILDKLRNLGTKFDEIEHAYFEHLDKTAAEAVNRAVNKLPLSQKEADTFKVRDALKPLDTGKPLKQPGSVDEAVGLYRKMLDEDDPDLH